MNQLANTTQAEVSVIEDLAIQAQMFSAGAAMNLLQLGRVLTEAKPLVRHGDWEGWVRENAHMPLRRAQEYMQAYKKFGIDQRIAQLGKSQIIALLPMSDDEREKLMAENDVRDMSSREISEALNAPRAAMRREAMREADRAVRAAEAARDDALRRLDEMESREAEPPKELLDELEKSVQEVKEAQESQQHFAEMAKQAIGEKAALEREKKALQAEIDECNDLLREQQETINRTQEELLSLKSAQARGDAGRESGAELTAEQLALAVREFVGAVARMPYMHGAFAGMAQKQKQEYEELLKTVEGWCRGAREALSSVAVSGVILDE